MADETKTLLEISQKLLDSIDISGVGGSLSVRRRRPIRFAPFDGCAAAPRRTRDGIANRIEAPRRTDNERSPQRQGDNPCTQ